MAGLDERDITILQHYAKTDNRTLYWNYLAQHQGSDSYGLLALGVVRNDNMPGAVANAFAQNRADRHLSEREWETFGQDLIKRDFALRQEWLGNHRPDLALNLPVKDVQKAHDGAFRKVGVDPNAWTPRQLLEAARRKDGDPAAEQVWRTMLDSKEYGSARLISTLEDIAYKYRDEKLSAPAYIGNLTAATAVAATVRPNIDPNVIGDAYSYYMYFDKDKAWASVSSMAGGRIQQVTDPKKISELDDARAVRMERQQKSHEFHPLDTNHEIRKSPFTIADAGPAQPIDTRMASQTADATPSASSRAATATSDLFARLTDAAMNRDVVGMRAAGQEFRQSDAGQQWLQSGREHNQEVAQQANQQAALALQQAPPQATQPEAPAQTGPVMRV